MSCNWSGSNWLLSCNQSSLWMHSNLHLLFWDKRRDRKSKGNQFTPSWNIFSMGNRCAEWPGGIITIAEFVFISLLWSIWLDFISLRSYLCILNFRSAQTVVLMKGTWPLTVGIWWVAMKVIVCFCSQPPLIGFVNYFEFTLFSLQTCGSCGNELSKCPICRKRIKIGIPLWKWVVHMSPPDHGVEI